jgi:hypothetical protein
MDHAAAHRLDLEPEIGWDDAVLLVWARTARGRIRCEIPRATIHAVPPFADALGREIARDRVEIVNRMRPALSRKIAAADSAVIRLNLEDM